MIEFEPRTSDFGSNHSTIWATTTTLYTRISSALLLVSIVQYSLGEPLRFLLLLTDISDVSID